DAQHRKSENHAGRDGVRHQSCNPIRKPLDPVVELGRIHSPKHYTDQIGRPPDFYSDRLEEVRRSRQDIAGAIDEGNNPRADFSWPLRPVYRARSRLNQSECVGRDDRQPEVLIPNQAGEWGPSGPHAGANLEATGLWLTAHRTVQAFARNSSGEPDR